MTVIAISQRVTVVSDYGERRDALDQSWTRFLSRCGIIALPVPNVPDSVDVWIEQLPVEGVLLTGGNDLAAIGGDAPERDETEARLIAMARERKWPLLGVCRGMQMIQHTFGVALKRIEGHVTPRQTVIVDGTTEMLNSYHDFGTTDTAENLKVWARAEDGIVEGVRHTSEKILGFMWHPERFESFREQDIRLVSEFFGSDAVKRVE